MKLLHGIPAAVSIATILHVGSAQTTLCVSGGFSMVVEECTFDDIYAAYETIYNEVECDHSVGEDFRLVLNLPTTATDAEVKAAVRSVCEAGWDNAEKVPFDATHRQGDDQFTQLYFNGGGPWNEEVETLLETGEATKVLAEDATNVNQFYNSLGRSAHVEWPDLPNFDLDTCEIRAAMCCWPQDRQANDGNGNCATPYDENCYDKDPADNTDLCFVDLTRSVLGNKFNNSGHVIYPNDDGNGEGAIHCHGFAWGNDDYDSISRFKANNLFYVSMYDHLRQRGYVRNVPGAPMCACMEQMPTVTRSDCTQIDVEEKYKLVHDPNTHSLTATVLEIEITFNACQGRYNRNNDLLAYVARLVEEGRLSNDQRAALDKYIVGNGRCHESADYELANKGYIPGYNYDASTWVQVAGSDMLYADGIGREGFRAMFAESPHPIVKRVCISCTETHQDIYYKRLTPIPDDLDLLEYMLNSWSNTNNAPETDFLIYSSFDDAINDNNPWTHYEFNEGRGFPEESGPTARTTQQWRKFQGATGRTDVAFYIMKSENPSVSIYDGSGELSGVNIDNPVVRGTTVVQNDIYYITGGGARINNEADQFYYLRTTSHGESDLVVKARVTSLRHRNNVSKGGIMIRASDAPGAQNFFCTMTPLNGVMNSRRTETGGTTAIKGSGNLASFVPTWLMITKVGDTYTCSYSSDGQTWAQMGPTVTMTMESEAPLVGMAVLSRNSLIYVGAEAVFEGYEVQASFSPSLAPSVTRTNDEDLWVPVIGSDSLEIAGIGREGFRALLAENPQPIVKRECLTCVSTHQVIYYKRLTPIPEELDLFAYFMDKWLSAPSNLANTDFLIYSSLDDAINDRNPWTFYNYRDARGFPYQSSPAVKTLQQWRRFSPGYGRTDVAFYIMKNRNGSLGRYDGSDGAFIGKDINNPFIKGSTLVEKDVVVENGAVGQSDIYYITAGGNNIWFAADQFYYLQDATPVGANMVVKAYITKFHTRTNWSRAGIMIRESDAPGSKNFFCLMSTLYGIRTQWRKATDGSAKGAGSSTSTPITPTWVMITKEGDTYTCSQSADGQTWAQVGNSIAISMTGPTVGMAVSSRHDTLGLGAEAVFESYSAVSA